jgi:hypothetical protein
MDSKEIPREQWRQFFDDFSKQHEDWIVTWEVLGYDLGDQEKAARLPLVGISLDAKGPEPRIDVMVGGRPDQHVTQIIRPKRVWVKEPEQPGHESIEIESDDGRVTLITFNHIDPDIEERLLPPTNG